MYYQKLITLYNSKSLDDSIIKNKLELAKPLLGRPKYRAVDKIDFNTKISNDITNLLSIAENISKVEVFENELNRILNEYYQFLIDSIDEINAWEYMKLDAKKFLYRDFEKLTKPEKFVKLYDINFKYVEFIEIQKMADFRDTFQETEDLTEEDINKMLFVKLMFNGFENPYIKQEFFCFNKKFLKALVDFKKSKVLRLDDYMAKRRKDINLDYIKYSNFFTTEDFRDITENLLLTSKTIGKSLSNIVDYYSSISESVIEEDDLRKNYEEFKKLEKKYLLMNSIKIDYEKDKRNSKVVSKTDNKKVKEKDNEKAISIEALRNKQEKLIAKQQEIIKKNEKLKNIEIKYKNENYHRLVKPLIFSWFDKEDITLSKKIGEKKLEELFAILCDLERENDFRISLYLVTNTNKKITLKRLQNIKEKAMQYGMNNLVEGALGGYSSFKIDKNENIIDIAKMSMENREKIKILLSKSSKIQLSNDLINETEENYIRYEIENSKDSTINMKYLDVIVRRLLEDNNIRRQPLKFIPYIERECSGIDVLLESQIKGISQLAEYYKSKYNVINGKSLQVNANFIESFFDKIRVNI